MISKDIVIMTRQELEQIKKQEFMRGYQFARGCIAPLPLDRSQYNAYTEYNKVESDCIFDKLSEEERQKPMGIS